jgi:hypothetical protein
MITILWLVVVGIITYFVYKSAAEYGRNAVVWALIVVILAFAILILLPFAAVVVITVFMLIRGKSVQQVNEYVATISFYLAVLPAILSCIIPGFILKFVAKMPEEKEIIQPPQPPTFD